MEPFALKALLLCFILNTCHVISIPIQADDSSVCQQLLPTLSRNTELYDCDALCEGNTANDRTTWCCRDIFTDYESDWPDTGVTREYWFEVDNRVLEPDGHPRAALAVNGSTGIPGPTIYADWGDMIVVHVFNNQSFKENFENSGLAIHWHGINQWETNAHDGVSAVTQCTIRPQSNMTYKWRATQYGTAWYHAHTSLKAWDGVFGGIVINGPSSANYDEDKGVLFLNDWSHHTPEEVFHTVQLFGPQVLANGLLNGTNIWSPTEDSYVCLLEKNHSPDSCFFKRSGISPNRTLGRRFSMEVESGKTYRIRLINAAIDNNFIFTIEGHNITVIAMDLVPICPFTTHSVKIQMGQRYDIVFTANSTDDGPFWIRATPNSGCGHIWNKETVLGILFYGDRDDTTPETLEDPPVGVCEDESMDLLSPVVQKDVPPIPPYAPFLPNPTNCSAESACPAAAFLISTTVNGPNTSAIFKWHINGQSMRSSWTHPTILNIKGNYSYEEANLFEVPESQEWVYLLINNTNPDPKAAQASIDHPVHLHGHDFYILYQGNTTWSSSMVKLKNPPRRDTALLYGAGGYLLLAWKANNPGVWLMHCHTGFHTAMGFDLQFLEKRQKLLETFDWELENGTCNEWYGNPVPFNPLQSAGYEAAGV